MVRAVAEILLAVAAGGMLWSAVGRVRGGRSHPATCAGCGRIVARVYPRCPRCGRRR